MRPIPFPLSFNERAVLKMYRIAILGCENSHANKFLDYVIGTAETPKIYSDVEVIGVFSEDRAVAEKLRDTYGVAVADSYDEFVGRVDGIIVTARHGDKHYEYAKPYLASGIPMFIDKPITVSEEDAIELRSELIKNKIRYSGGSVCKYPALIRELAKAVNAEYESTNKLLEEISEEWLLLTSE